MLTKLYHLWGSYGHLCGLKWLTSQHLLLGQKSWNISHYHVVAINHYWHIVTNTSTNAVKLSFSNFNWKIPKKFPSWGFYAESGYVIQIITFFKKSYNIILKVANIMLTNSYHLWGSYDHLCGPRWLTSEQNLEKTRYICYEKVL